MNSDYPLHPSLRDWTEDSSHENGNYLCHCVDCEKTFIGYKRRVQCKVCAKIAEEKWNKLTPEEQEARKRETIETVTKWLDSWTKVVQSDGQ